MKAAGRREACAHSFTTVQKSVSVDEVPDAKIEKPTDALIRITTTNICGSDLHMYEGRTDEAVRPTGRIGVVGVFVPEDPNAADKLKPGVIVSHELDLDQAAEGYANFDDRKDGWTKVILRP